MKGFWLVGALALGCVAQGWAAENDLPPIPDRPEAELFKDAPAPWRDYLLKARAAERIADPLQRCLAYPDLPGNQWPAGHARAHCMDHTVRAMEMADAQKLLDAGRADELEAYVRKTDALHGTHNEVSEEIHYFFQQFATENAGAFTAAWLKARPESAYALTARANFHAWQARDARGGKWASETPREDLRQMTAYYDQALPLYRKAVANAPMFIEAWTGIFSLGYRDSRPDLVREAFAAGNRIDSGCLDFADTVMTSLQPRWGGSYEAMLAYAQTLQPLLKARPNLARMLAAPYGDRGDRLIAGKELAAEARDILDIAVRTASVEDHLSDAANVALNASDGVEDRWKALAYVLQEVRFHEAGEWSNRIIAKSLVRSDPAWALRYARKAVAADPGSTVAQYYLGASAYNARRFEEAEQAYLLAAKDTDWAQASLQELVAMWMFDAGLTPIDGSKRAKPYLDRLIREFPKDGRARMYRIQSEGAINRRVSDDLIKDFETRADPGDPAQARFLKMLADARKNPIIRQVPAKAK